ncbi:MLP-like protein 423 isoform X1 [Lycium ferocissimum]|uniref:MLP-like protein 423 isoform X1 n=1 Tax=Lycium ferocissimum TaxID=112874 RepID=UPI0028156A7A|nr:MLP-like protein 423 isoform X1 [Lycium ferocissimum]
MLFSIIKHTHFFSCQASKLSIVHFIYLLLKGMAQIHRIELQAEIKSSPEKLFNVYKNKTFLLPKISPHKLQSIKVLEGDGKSVGSIRLWTYNMGAPVIAKDRIDAIDEKNNSMTFELIGGEVTKYFMNFKATIKVTNEGNRNSVNWSLEYEKANEDVPTPYSHLDYLVGVSREVDAYLLL